MDNDLVRWTKKREQAAEIEVRVDTVEEPSDFSNGKSAYFKFFVANEKALRIQCIAPEDQTERIRYLVKKDTIIRIKGATCKRETNPKYNYGDVPFVLMINANTKITFIRDCSNSDDDESEEDSESISANGSSLDRIATVINNNTAAMKELAAALKTTRRDWLE